MSKYDHTPFAGGTVCGGGNCGSGAEAGRFQITADYEKQGMSVCLCASAPLDIPVEYFREATKREPEAITRADAVDELQALLEFYIGVRVDIRNKLFIRKKERALWLAVNQRDIEALSLAIEILSKPEVTP